jgi:hypothetical protein
MHTLFGVICPYCTATTYVYPPEAPDQGEAENEVGCGSCHHQIVVWTQATGVWSVRKQARAEDP